MASEENVSGNLSCQANKMVKLEVTNRYCRQDVNLVTPLGPLTYARHATTTGIALTTLTTILYPEFKR